MFMRVSSFLLSRAPTEQEIRETGAMVAWFHLAARLFDALEGVAIRLAGFFASDIEMLQPFRPVAGRPVFPQPRELTIGEMRWGMMSDWDL
jgi:hypothetical protein